jgi:WD40 repeat protein
MVRTNDPQAVRRLKIGAALLGLWVEAYTAVPRTACGDEPQAKPVPPTVRCLAYSPDGLSLAIAGNEDKRGLLVVWDLKVLKPRFRHREPVGCRSVAFSPDGRTIALARDAPDALLLDAGSGEPSKVLVGHRNNVMCLTFTPDGHKLITGAADRTVRIWDVATGKEEAVLEEQKEAIFSVDVSRDGKRMATTDGRGGTARLWDLERRRVLHSIDQPFTLIPHVRFSPDGRLLAISSWRGTLSLLDTTTYGIRMHFQNNHGIKWSDFSPDQKWLAVASFSTVVEVHPFNLAIDEVTKVKVAALLSKFQDDSCPVREAAHRELAAIATAAEPQLREGAISDSAEVRWRCRKLLARLSQPESAVRLEGHKGELTCVAFSPDGRHLASGDDQGDVRLWRIDNWKAEASIPITEATTRRN